MACVWFRVPFTQFRMEEVFGLINIWAYLFIGLLQVAKSMETLISQSIATPNDPRREELEQMEKQKSVIDQKAKTLVQGELYCGLGFLVLQTLGFMRLTFWELSWDVMEPICFFVTSLHFAGAYAFFLRTSKEPSFEGYFQRRFKAKQKQLMKTHNFDLEKYNNLCRAFYPNYYSPNSDHFPPSWSCRGSFFWSSAPLNRSLTHSQGIKLIQPIQTLFMINKTGHQFSLWPSKRQK